MSRARNRQSTARINVSLIGPNSHVEGGKIEGVTLIGQVNHYVQDEQKASGNVKIKEKEARDTEVNVHLVGPGTKMKDTTIKDVYCAAATEEIVQSSFKVKK